MAESRERTADSPVVREVRTRSDRRQFQRVPWLIYNNAGGRDPNWVPPLLAQERQLLGWGSHPFYDNAEATTLLAEVRGRPAGRLAVLVNHVHNRRYDEQRGFFGFFECVNDVEVARALFDAGEQWLADRGMTSVRGPANPSLNHTCGLLVQDHGPRKCPRKCPQPRPPRFMMTYNPPYYSDLLESCGFTVSQEMFAYELETPEVMAAAERYKRAVQAAMHRGDVIIRPFDPKRFAQEVRTFLEIYNRSLEGTWGFAPLQPREAEHMARELRHVLVPEFAMFAEVGGRPIGAVLALLDYNQVLRKLNGRLLPLGWLRLLLGRRPGAIDAVRTVAITVTSDHQNTGLAVALMSRLIETANKRGIRHWEFSWVLESNHRSRRPLEKCGMRIGKVYRMYDKAIGGH